MGLATFIGGIHPYEGKELSEDKPIKVLEPLQGEIMVYPLSQHIGAPAKPLVAKGDHVLKGQIIAADPTSTSSGWNNLAAMLTVMGNGDASSEAGWNYVTKLIANLNGKISSSSSKVYKSVYEGEYPVGITYEGPCVTYKDDGVGDGIDIVYMKEGTTVTPFGAAIIKDAKNMELAKIFIDWITSDECQGMLAASVQRGANMNIPTTNPNLLDASEIKFVDSDQEYLSTHQAEIQEKWTELWTAAYGSNTVDIAG